MITPPLLTAYHPSGNPVVSFFTLHCIESDSSRLRFEPGVGTILDTAMPREFELRIYERDQTGYSGLAAQFPLDRLSDALTMLLDLSAFSPLTIQQHARTLTR